MQRFLIISVALFSESRDVDNFSGIQFNILGEAIITQGNTPSVTVDADNADVTMTGLGSIQYDDGTIDEQTIGVRGSGNYNARAVVSRNTTARVSGSGSIDVTVENRLNGTISGSGDIIYTGNPDVSINDSGSGNLNHRGS